MLPSDPLVTLDVWRRIKQLSDPHSRQITLLWVPLNNPVLRNSLCCHALAASANGAFVSSTFPALLPTCSSEVIGSSGHRTANIGAGGGPIKRPRQSSPSARDGATSLLLLFSTRAPTSPLTFPSRPTEAEVSSRRQPDRSDGFLSFQMITVEFIPVPLHRIPPSFEAAARRRLCSL